MDFMDSILSLLLMSIQHISSAYCNGTVVLSGDVFEYVWSMCGTRDGDICFARCSLKRIGENPSPCRVLISVLKHLPVYPLIFTES